MIENRHAKVSVTLPSRLLAEIDALVAQGAYKSRSAALEEAASRLMRARTDALIERGLEETDWDEEAALAEEGMADWSELVRRDEA